MIATKVYLKQLCNLTAGLEKVLGFFGPRKKPSGRRVFGPVSNTSLPRLQCGIGDIRRLGIESKSLPDFVIVRPRRRDIGIRERPRCLSSSLPPGRGRILDLVNEDGEEEAGGDDADDGTDDLDDDPAHGESGAVNVHCGQSKHCYTLRCNTLR